MSDAAEPHSQAGRQPSGQPGLGPRTGKQAAEGRIAHQQHWVDFQINQAAARGDFDDLPGFGKPLDNLGQDHDPDWWVKQLIAREQITGVLPPSLALRKEDAMLPTTLDALNSEREVRRHLEDFNARVLKARYSQLGGPPLVTLPKDVETEVSAWRARRPEHRVRRTPPPAAPTGRIARWWARWRTGSQS